MTTPWTTKLPAKNHSITVNLITRSKLESAGWHTEIYNGNWTEWSAIRFEIIRMISKARSFDLKSQVWFQPIIARQKFQLPLYYTQFEINILSVLILFYLISTSGNSVLSSVGQSCLTFFLRISMHLAVDRDTSPVHSIKASLTSSGLILPISCEFSGTASSTITLWIKSYQVVCSQWTGPWGSSIPSTDARFNSSAVKPSFSALCSTKNKGEVLLIQANSTTSDTCDYNINWIPLRVDGTMTNGTLTEVDSIIL